MKKIGIALATIVIFVGCCVCATMTGWLGTWYSNTAGFVNQKIDDATSYEKKKKVEDTCRAMISSYESDKMTYEQYKNSDNE